jgi:molecular chaperone GrpE
MSQEDVKHPVPPEEVRTAGEPEQQETEPKSSDEVIEQLRQQLEAAQAEARANHDRFLRERAELENFKKRMQRETAEALRFACEPLIRELLPVVDNLERAAEHAPDDGPAILEGVRLVLKAFVAVLDRYGVRGVDALGEPFDPSRHQAMAQVESAEDEPNRVVEQHHRGYLLHDRLLRPALVTVSRRKQPDTVESEQNSD